MRVALKSELGQWSRNLLTHRVGWVGLGAVDFDLIHASGESWSPSSLYEPLPPRWARARKTVELGYKTAASAFSFGSSASIKVSGLLLLRLCPLVLGISCCRSLDPSRHFLLLMRRGKTGRHGRARADREEVRRMCGGSPDGAPPPPYSCSQFGFNWFGIGMTRAYLSQFGFNWLGIGPVLTANIMYRQHQCLRTRTL